MFLSVLFAAPFIVMRGSLCLLWSKQLVFVRFSASVVCNNYAIANCLILFSTELLQIFFFFFKKTLCKNAIPWMWLCKFFLAKKKSRQYRLSHITFKTYGNEIHLNKFTYIFHFGNYFQIYGYSLVLRLRYIVSARILNVDTLLIRCIRRCCAVSSLSCF